jgi:hypothetical protein
VCLLSPFFRIGFEKRVQHVGGWEIQHKIGSNPKWAMMRPKFIRLRREKLTTTSSSCLQKITAYNNQDGVDSIVCAKFLRRISYVKVHRSLRNGKSKGYLLVTMAHTKFLPYFDFPYCQIVFARVFGKSISHVERLEGKLNLLGEIGLGNDNRRRRVCHLPDGSY